MVVRYNLLVGDVEGGGGGVGDEGGRWINPCLKVMDRYFNKSLKVQGTEGMRIDAKKGVGIWVPAWKGE